MTEHENSKANPTPSKGWGFAFWERFLNFYTLNLDTISIFDLHYAHGIIAGMKKASPKKKDITLNDLAFMMGRGFNEVDKRFTEVHEKMDKGFADVYEKINENTKEIKAVKAEVNLLKNGIEKFIMFYEKQEQEFSIMKDEVRRIKLALEEKLGIKI